MAKIKYRPAKRIPSRRIVAARRAGIDIDIQKPHLPITEQEQTDTM